jgi:protein-disulfide isomerase
VEFFDYNCGFCQRALDDMNRLIEGGSKIRFVLKEFPVLGEESVQASRVSIAFNRLMPLKAAEFHRALLGAPGRKDGQMALDLAVKLGANIDALKAEAEKPDVSSVISEAYRLGDGLGISGTPSYVIGDEIVFGAVGFDSLSQKVANLGTCGKTIC